MQMIKSIGSISSICQSHINNTRLTDGKKTLSQLLREEREELFGKNNQSFRVISEVMPVSVKPNKQDRRPLRYREVIDALQEIIEQIPASCNVTASVLFVNQTFAHKYWTAVASYILHECYFMPNLQIRSFLPLERDVTRLVRRVILPIFDMKGEMLEARGFDPAIDYETQFYDMFDYFMILKGREYA